MEFNRVINILNLVDVPLIGRKFTWSNQRPNPTFSRLDRSFISGHWETMGVTYNLNDLSVSASDHTPLSLIIKPQGNSTKRRFKFENSWLLHNDLCQVVTNAWGSVTETSLHPKYFHVVSNARKNCNSISAL